MALQFKVLGQANPAGNTNVTLYSVPSGTSAVISTLNVCNYNTSSATFSISALLSPNFLAKSIINNSPGVPIVMNTVA